MGPYQNYPTNRFDDLGQLYRTSAATCGDKTAFLQKEAVGLREISYRRFGSDADALGTALFAHGLDGKRILLIGKNCYEWALSYLTVVLLHKAYPGRRREEIHCELVGAF